MTSPPLLPPIPPGESKVPQVVLLPCPPPPKLGQVRVTQGRSVCSWEAWGEGRGAGNSIVWGGEGQQMIQEGYPPIPQGLRAWVQAEVLNC